MSGRGLSKCIGHRAASARTLILHPETQPVTRATTATNQLQIPVIEEEEPFQLSPRNRTRELPVHRYLIITQELNWHTTNLKPIPSA